MTDKQKAVSEKIAAYQQAMAAAIAKGKNVRIIPSKDGCKIQLETIQNIEKAL